VTDSAIARVPIDDLDFGPDQVQMWNGQPFTGVAFENAMTT
jgi:hypothetical protein